VVPPRRTGSTHDLCASFSCFFFSLFAARQRLAPSRRFFFSLAGARVVVPCFVLFGVLCVCSAARGQVDFVHRSGRTARAGRRGRALTLVTQHDVELVHAVESHVGRSLAAFKGVTEDDVVPLLNSVAKAQRVARARLSEVGFDEQVAKLKAKAAKRRAEDGKWSGGGGEASAASSSSSS